MSAATQIEENSLSISTENNPTNTVNENEDDISIVENELNNQGNNEINEENSKEEENSFVDNNEGQEKEDSTSQPTLETVIKSKTICNETPSRKKNAPSSKRKPTFNSISNYEEVVEQEKITRKKTSKKSKKSKRGKSEKQTPTNNQNSSSSSSSSHRAVHKDDSYYIKLNNSYFSNSVDKNDTSDTDLSAGEDLAEINASSYDAELSCIKEYESSWADISWRWKWLKLNISNLSKFLIDCEDQFQTVRTNKLQNRFESLKSSKPSDNNDNDNNNNDNNDNNNNKNDNICNNVNNVTTEQINVSKEHKDELEEEKIKEVQNDNNNNNSREDNNDNSNTIINSDKEEMIIENFDESKKENENIHANNNNNDNDNNNNNNNNNNNGITDEDFPLRCRKFSLGKSRSIIKNKTFFILRKREDNLPLFLSQRKIHELMEFNRPLPKKSVNSKYYRRKHDKRHYKSSPLSSSSIRKSAKYKNSRLRSSSNNNNNSLASSHSHGGKKKLHTRRTSDFNINNIVLHSSYASPTQIRKINYKEIFIPHYRIVDDYFDDEIKHKKNKRNKKDNNNIITNNIIINDNNNNNNNIVNQMQVIVQGEDKDKIEGSSSENTDNEYYEELHHRKEVEERKRYCVPPKKIRKKKMSLSLDSLPTAFDEIKSENDNEDRFDLGKNSLSCSTSAVVNFPDTFYVTTNQFADGDPLIDSPQRSPIKKNIPIVHSVLLSSPSSSLSFTNKSIMESKKRKRNGSSSVFWEVNKKIPPIDDKTHLPKIIIYLKKKV